MIIHSEPGFISPVGIKKIAKKGTAILIVADESLRGVRNAYGGANKKHRDMFNMNIDRDYQPDVEGDIALPPADCQTADGKKLLEGRGIEVGNIFQLGTHYSTRMARAMFTDESGKGKPYYMGCYGIGIGRSMAAVVEVHHDDKGILWPKSVAPYQVHLLSLPGGEKEADKLYEKLLGAGVEVLYDDRDERAGVKLNDADLIGIPIRLLLSERTLKEKGVEWKERSKKDTESIKLSQVLKAVQDFYSDKITCFNNAMGK
ncbi:MAG: His/Gly/Thr/Pro-type tRNA ligase C-terminal domain-containing protein, partial [Candidatus Peregrinibacteria bacterium]